MQEKIDFYGMGLYSQENVFRPGFTTKMIIGGLPVNNGDVVVDVGCGIGPIAVYAAIKGASRVYAIDVMQEACDLTEKNAGINGVGDTIEVMCGHLLEPLKGNGVRANTVVIDVPGLPEKVARMSGWYPQGIPVGCERGSELYVESFGQLSEFLEGHASVYFPVGADKEATLQAASGVFRQLECVAQRDIPCSSKLNKAIKRGELDAVLDLFLMKQKGSRYLWTLEIYRGDN